MIDYAWDAITERAWEWIKQFNYDPEELEDDAEVRRLYIHEWLGQNAPIMTMEMLITDEIYARRVVLREWLREKGVYPDDVLVFETEHISVEERAERDARAYDLCCGCGWNGPPPIRKSCGGDHRQRPAALCRPSHV
jgi:DNA-directed RNA polymerase subunit beta